MPLRSGSASALTGCAGLHQVVHQAQHERRLAAARLRHRQQMAAAAARRQYDRHLVALVLRNAQSAAFTRPGPTVAASGSRRRAVVRSRNGASSAPCGRCHRPASSREFSKHGRTAGSGASIRRSAPGTANRDGGTKLLPAASANGR